MSAVRDTDTLEARTQAIGQELFHLARQEHERLSVLNRWTTQVLSWCLGDPDLKSHVLQFIDCLPSLRTPRQIVRHVRDYFPTDRFRLPPALRAGVLLTRSGLITAPALAAAVRHLTEAIARQFIGSARLEDAPALLERLAARQALASVDLLGELVLSEPEADRYAEQYLRLMRLLSQQRPPPPSDSPIVARPRAHVSIKPSSLSARVDPASVDDSVERILSRLLPIARAAVELDVAVTLDMEQEELRDLTLAVAKRLLTEPSVGEGIRLGVVLQAYLTDTESTLNELLRWLERADRRLAVRLVKGAYWDFEIARAMQRGWPTPVYHAKWQTDQAFERLTHTLLAAHPRVQTEIASHNLRSIAHAMAVAEQMGRVKTDVEFQLLYGMADAVQGAIAQRGYPTRLYSPVGELIPGMAYLVRRLLENTSNESFLRHDFLRDEDPAQLLRAPGAGAPDAASVTMPQRFVWPGEPLRDFSKSEPRDRFAHALETVRAHLGRRYPVLLGDASPPPSATSTSRNPAHPEQVIGLVGQAGAAEADRAVHLANDAQPRWAATPVARRAACLRKAAELMRRRRDELAAWELLEVGKTWREADADVVEAIDYLDYYAEQMEALAWRVRLPQLPGERNTWLDVPRGVAVVIVPWNFPAAILTGMASAALVSGNAVILKPAERSSVVAAHVAQILREAGIPPAILQCVPGPGEEVGAALVQHPGTHAILFTGSRAVGLSIIEAASRVAPGQRFVKHVITEMGGKNAIIVDADADLDAAIQGTLVSAFGYGGQKCSAASRLIVHEAVYDLLLPRLVAAADRLVVGDPADPRTDLGPLIEAGAQQRLQEAIAEAAREATVAYAYPASRLPQQGYFVGPTIVTGVPPTHRLAQAELFGPLLCVFRVKHFRDALALANDTDYGLTGGVYSRLPAHIEQAKAQLAVGNLYINRPIIGAIVGRQPFGGFKLSGLGTKAGGPDYLHQLVVPKTICENTARHGMPLE